MLRRLAEFRERDTEDTTVLNFFDELEIHPVVIDAMTYDLETATERIATKVGNPITFVPTLEEEKEMAKVESENAESQRQQIIIEREVKRCEKYKRTIKTKLMACRLARERSARSTARRWRTGCRCSNSSRRRKRRYCLRKARRSGIT